MTELTDVLSGAAEPAIYRIPPEVAPGDVAAAAADAGWQFIHVDGSATTDKAALMEVMESSFGFPEWFGRNLDALADSLSDVRHERGTVVLWDRADVFAAADPRQYNAVLSVLLSRSRSHAGGPFLTLLRDGTPTNVPGGTDA